MGMTDLFDHPSSDPTSRPESDIELGRFNRNPPGLTLGQLIREDFATHGRDFFSQGFWAIAVHRFGNWRMDVRPGVLRLPLSLIYRVLSKCVQWFGGIDLMYTVRVGRRVRVWHHGGMTLEALEIGDDVHIRQNVTFGLRKHGDARWLKPIIAKGCQIGAGAVIVGPIIVGEGSTIGANVVLAQDVPPHSIVTVPKPVVRRLP
jgi:serine O-acetyltransferase